MSTVIDLLVEQALGGDPEAFVELIAKHRGLMLRTAKAILKNHDDVDDVIQDVTVKVFCKLGTFNGEAAFSTWLTRIVINQCLAHLRKVRRARVSSFEDLADDDKTQTLDPADPRPGPEQQVISSQYREHLRQGVAGLPPIFRHVVVDLVYKGMPVAQIAKRHKISHSAAKSRVIRARAILTKSVNNPSTVPLSRPAA
jgi:RNA polymerase sigma-70 factor (ECF subfamily)